MRYARLKVMITLEPRESEVRCFLPTDVKAFYEARSVEPPVTVALVSGEGEPDDPANIWIDLDMSRSETEYALNLALAEDVADASWLTRATKQVPMPVDLDEVHDEEPVKLPEDLLDSE